MLVGDTVRVPLVAFVPVQPPEAVQEVASVEDQVTTETLPEVMLVGLAENDAVGARGGWCRRKSTKFRKLPSGPSSVEKSEPFTAAVAIIRATMGPDTAGEASTNGDSTITETSALASRALAS